MIKLSIVSSSLQISLNGTIILVAPKNSCAINVLKLYDAIPQISIYNKYLGNSTSIFNQPLSNCENGGGTPFTIDSFIYFAELNLGFDTFSNGGGSLCNPFEYNITNACGVQPCLGTNSAIGYYSVIRGGLFNTISMGIYSTQPSYAKSCSTISGGYQNTISGYYPTKNTIIGGGVNTINEPSNSVIGGGVNNIDNSTSFYGSMIGGGTENVLSGIGSPSIVSGCKNINSNGIIIGGYNNIVTNGGTTLNGVCNVNSSGDITNGFGNQSCFGFIKSGKLNFVIGTGDIINGGCNNRTDKCIGQTYSHCYSLIGGGIGNCILLVNEDRSIGHSIGGGVCNLISTSGFLTNSCMPSLIINGFCNCIISSAVSTIGGGEQNKICAISLCSTIIGGTNNLINGTGGTFCHTSIIGGGFNSVCCSFGIVASGTSNSVRNSFGFIGNGKLNISCGTNCNGMVINGYNNINCIANSSILNGKDNRQGSSQSHILGTGITVSRNATALVNNISIMDIPTSDVGLPTKAVWNNNGVLNIVP